MLTAPEIDELRAELAQTHSAATLSEARAAAALERIESLERIADSARLAALTRLDAFRELEPGWDSYEAKPIAEEALILAALLLRSPEIFPTVEGGIQLEWREHKPGGLYVEIEVLPDGMIEVLLMRGDEAAQEWSKEAMEPVREAAESWHALMSEAAEHLKEPEHLARVAKVERAIEEKAEERRLLLELERADEAQAVEFWAQGQAHEKLAAARSALRAFRARQKEAGP